MFPVTNRSSRYPKKSKVLGIIVDGLSKAYPFKELRDHGSSTFIDTINGKPYTIHWSEEDEYARIVSADGDEFPSVIVYWFAWFAFHPETLVFEDRSADQTR
jgi:hypothetical protein